VGGAPYRDVSSYSMATMQQMVFYESFGQKVVYALSYRVIHSGSMLTYSHTMWSQNLETTDGAMTSTLEIIWKARLHGSRTDKPRLRC
jgi:hypothetical protein